MIIRNVRVVDGTGAPAVAGQALQIRAGRIAWIGADGSVPGEDGGTTIDGSGLTVLPGLIDCHVHLAHNADPDHFKMSQRTAADEAVDVVRNAITTLARGITTVRDCGGGRTRGPLALSRAADLGVPIPRIVSCGAYITMTGGHLHREAVEADGAAELRKAVRAEIKAGAHWIKVMATGGVLTPGTDLGAASYTQEELEAVVAEARRAGRRVAAHAIGTEGIKNAVRAGVNTIEHGSFLDDEAIRLMLDGGVTHVATLSAYHRVVEHGIAGGIPDDAVNKATRAKDANEESFRRSLAAGVRLAAGTDAGTPYNVHGSLGHELMLMVAAGATPEQAIRFGTSLAAATLGLESETGTLAPGKAADIVGVYGDPLERIDCLMAPDLVVRGGRIAAASAAADHIAKTGVA